jgi:hypothetical protein
VAVTVADLTVAVIIHKRIMKIENRNANNMEKWKIEK